MFTEQELQEINQAIATTELNYGYANSTQVVLCALRKLLHSTPTQTYHSIIDEEIGFNDEIEEIIAAEEVTDPVTVEKVAESSTRKRKSKS